MRDERGKLIMITVDNKDMAFRIASDLYAIKDFSRDVTASKNAGYPVYRSNSEYYNYICDLGDHFECNFVGGGSINVWIKSPSKSVEPTVDVKEIKDLFGNILSNGLTVENMKEMFNLYTKM